MGESPIKNVSDTAFMIAVYRAMESERPDALFHDPLARKLAGEHGQKIVDDMSGDPGKRGSLFLRAGMVGWTVAIRTRVIDTFLQSAIVQGCDAVLNLACDQEENGECSVSLCAEGLFRPLSRTWLAF